MAPIGLVGTMTPPSPDHRLRHSPLAIKFVGFGNAVNGATNQPIVQRLQPSLIYPGTSHKSNRRVWRPSPSDVRYPLGGDNAFRDQVSNHKSTQPNSLLSPSAEVSTSP